MGAEKNRVDEKTTEICREARREARREAEREARREEDVARYNESRAWNVNNGRS